jgi:biopolymer transport protein TolR
MSMGSVRPAGRKRRLPMADINVTPMVDVMLVLLVIFMITAPALKDGIDVDLPKTQGGGSGGKPATPMTVVIDAEGKVHVANTTLDPAQVAAELPKLLKGHEKESVTLKAHRKLHYDAVVKVIAVMRASGVSGISIAVDRE